MAIYDGFAALYAHGPYPRYSRRMAEAMPTVLKRLGAAPRTLLDVACGEGTFAVAMAQGGLAVTGIDQSARMLECARQRAREAEAEVDFVQADMRSPGLAGRFDLVTCWYDSLNYLLTSADLRAAFREISGLLSPQGLFIFDMNTICGLAVLWKSHPYCIIQDGDDIFDVHANSYDHETGIATKRIVGFVRRGDAWIRIEEEHIERGHSLAEIRACLAAAGLREIACWGSIETMTEPGPDAGRVWLVAKPADI
ncbi:MAG: class I SAM-dependent methyltransferase [bacterium]